MSFTFWRFPSRSFTIDGLDFRITARGKSDGMHSALSMLGVETATDFTPNFGPDAVRNHMLHATLPDGRKLEVEMGYITSFTTGIIARLDGRVVHESHPGRTPAYPEKYREMIVNNKGIKETYKSQLGDRPDPLSTGVFAKGNRLPFAVDIATGLLFYFVAKATDLNTAALLGIAVGFGLVIFQRITRIDVTGGLVLFGIVMMAISAGLALWLQDEYWIKIRGTITGIIAASFFLIDGLRGGPYIGKGLARYMPYADIHKGKLAAGLGLVGLVMAALNYAAAKWLTTDQWLFYKTFVDFILAAGLTLLVMNYARGKASKH